MDFQLSAQLLDSTSIIRVRGELDVCTTPALRDYAFGLLSGPRAVLILHLAEVTFMDAAGLRTLLQLREHARRSAGIFGIANPAPVVLELLVLTGLSGYFDCYPTVSIALAVTGEGR